MRSKTGKRLARAGLATAAAGTVTWIAFGMHADVPGLDQFDLAVHETGHLLTAFTPRMVMMMAGSAAQILFPLVMAAYFGLRRRDTAAAGFCLAWAGESARDVSVYAGDAVRQALPLIGGGEHDWAYILGPNGFDALSHTAAVAQAIAFVGLSFAIVGIVLAVATAFAPRRTRTPAIAAVPAVARDLPRVRAATHATATSNPGTGWGEPADPWAVAASLPFHHEAGGDRPQG